MSCEPERDTIIGRLPIADSKKRWLRALLRLGGRSVVMVAMPALAGYVIGQQVEAQDNRAQCDAEVQRVYQGYDKTFERLFGRAEVVTEQAAESVSAAQDAVSAAQDAASAVARAASEVKRGNTGPAVVRERTVVQPVRIVVPALPAPVNKPAVAPVPPPPAKPFPKPWDSPIHKGLPP